MTNLEELKKLMDEQQEKHEHLDVARAGIASAPVTWHFKPLIVTYEEMMATQLAKALERAGKAEGEVSRLTYEVATLRKQVDELRDRVWRYEQLSK